MKWNKNAASQKGRVFRSGLLSTAMLAAVLVPALGGKRSCPVPKRRPKAAGELPRLLFRASQQALSRYGRALAWTTWQAESEAAACLSSAMTLMSMPALAICRKAGLPIRAARAGSQVQ